MDLIDSEERFLQKAVGKKHNFSNCECGFFCHNLVFIFIIGKQSNTLQNPFHEKKLCFCRPFHMQQLKNFMNSPKLMKQNPTCMKGAFWVWRGACSPSKHTDCILCALCAVYWPVLNWQSCKRPIYFVSHMQRKPFGLCKITFADHLIRVGIWTFLILGARFIWTEECDTETKSNCLTWNMWHLATLGLQHER